MITSEGAFLRARLRSMGVYCTDSHANFVYLPSGARAWTFGDDGPRVRSYANGGVRITVGDRRSSRAVLAAIRNAVNGATVRP